MTQQEIQERNKQIATMLRYKLITPSMRKNPGEWSISYWQKDHPEKQDVLCSEKYLPFHSDWNWLMKAVEFIEEKLNLETVISNMGFGSNNQYININRDISIINETIDNPSKIMGKSSSKKEAVFIAVSDFAKLYNENLK